MAVFRVRVSVRVSTFESRLLDLQFFWVRVRARECACAYLPQQRVYRVVALVFNLLRNVFRLEPGSQSGARAVRKRGKVHLHAAAPSESLQKMCACIGSYLCPLGQEQRLLAEHRLVPVEHERVHVVKERLHARVLFF